MFLPHLLALVVLIPLSIFTAVYIYTLDKGPVVIKQKRVGLHGSEFNMYKFRTMKQRLSFSKRGFKRLESK
jgi:lipopolysaccharide/colanic/teichoic acid biosynthesis glycosyltransferase